MYFFPVCKTNYNNILIVTLFLPLQCSTKTVPSQSAV